MSNMELGSLVYYQEHQFNPVPIDVEEASVWQSHFAKRQNLYQRHLGIPLSLLQNRSICEFGCNSGENALVLASVGANLTLVEPNQQVHARLRTLFKKFGLTDRVVALVEEDIETFDPQTHYDVVIAEGFLYTLPNRDELLKKMCDMLAPGGLGIITYNDRYGGLLEITKRMLLWRGCQLLGIGDIHSEASLDAARQLFFSDFSKINVSRPFKAWWKDELVSPFAFDPSLWSYPELLPLIEGADCEFYSSSPQWTLSDHFRWYKNVPDQKSRRQDLLADWSRAFTYICTGLQSPTLRDKETPREVVDAVGQLVAAVSQYTSDYAQPIEATVYPSVLSQFFAGLGNPELSRLNREMELLYEVAASGNWDELLSTYQDALLVRGQWGSPCHYLAFTKPLIAMVRRYG